MENKPVSAKLMDAIQVQNELFDLIWDHAEELSIPILGREIAISQNFWNTERYRSILMTFDLKLDIKKGNIPDGAFPYGWLIYYEEQPTIIHFVEKVGNQWENMYPFDLKTMNYFQATEQEKIKMVRVFLISSFLKIKHSLK